MKNLLDLSIEELKELVSPSFRATQIYEWVYKKNATEFSQMLNLPKDMRQDLADKFYLDPLKCVKFEQSSDGSIKYLFELKDGLKIESVLLPMKEEISNEDGKVSRHARYTVCVSSQVGCKMGCAFCLTAKGGLVRNLTAGEIVGQILWIKRENNIPYERRINVVYMGMGEPLDNLANVSKAIKILALNEGLAISPRRQTVSTSGLGSQIKKLGEMDLGVLLAISLHAVTNELRSRLMPINKAYNIEAVMDAVRGFPIDMRKRVMFEYLVIKDLNDSVSDAKKLVKLLHGIKAKVNLIYFNPHEGSEFGRPELTNMLKFQEYLRDHGVTCTIRQSKGLDISAACGQLKQRNENPKFKANVSDKNAAKAEEKPTNDKTNVSKK
ncbi:Ribosomal RNA large subunit methyltransferase N [Campylobacter concisus UNSWCS]|uniref:Probable dual-specificity RNA methyltransferase RlmN n=1 Tax=Campylobacter concisus UNSWCS TaxID=1242968 RepID=U2FIT6_9BACT|nr:23S rRNA (adenine(2503)-C(2))-methyltransferase RlmN [Campylobacter concisus]ERJ30487.1 Ribosomal RNA large subunit methyltransferase N [Campylobacter concisus UNSWCS]